MNEIGTHLNTAMKGCDKVINNMRPISKKAQDLLKMADWKQWALKLYE